MSLARRVVESHRRVLGVAAHFSFQTASLTMSARPAGGLHFSKFNELGAWYNMYVSVGCAARVSALRRLIAAPAPTIRGRALQI